MAVKTVSTEIIDEILQTLGLKKFSRPYAAMIDPGDFGTVATYIPLFPDEYKKLPPNLQAHVYLVAPGQYGLICFLPRTFESPDGGKPTEVSTTHDVWGKMVRVAYKTDRGGEFETEHSIRRDRLLLYAKKKKLPISNSVKISS
ncbi:MAG: hypothetical protein PWR01_3428 [Clostridiales bacterium]|jgi:hypothetical protein|nr:hypothetical protein [Clostridiales bacterium]MDN5282355.1 hypothetical protein [Candidatus Ozemobacter sp.]